MCTLSTVKLPPPKFEPRSVEIDRCAGVPRAAGLKAPTAATYWRTLRHLRWSQLGYLALRRVLPRAMSPAKLEGSIGLRDLPGAWPFLDWQPEASRKTLATREFTFLNRTVACNGSIPWND